MNFFFIFRNASAELFRVKNGYEEAIGQLDEVKRENKSLSDEIKDLMEQISEGGRSIHEIEKQRKKLEAEKFELETALGDAESALEQVCISFLRHNPTSRCLNNKIIRNWTFTGPIFK